MISGVFGLAFLVLTAMVILSLFTNFALGTWFVMPVSWVIGALMVHFYGKQRDRLKRNKQAALAQR